MKRLLLILTVSFLVVAAWMCAVSVKASTGNEEPKSAPAMDWRITGPTGGDVRALVIDPNDPQRLYFGTLDGQIYTSGDGAQQWRLLVNFGRPQLFVDHIIVDPRDSKTLYVATHRHKDPGGFFKSTDGGATWRESPELKGEAVHSLTQSSKNPDILIAGTNRGIYRSNDAGESWTQLPTSSVPQLVNVESLAVDPRNTDTIYAGTWWLPYKSTDGGQTWNIIKTGLIDDSDVFAIDIDPRNPDHIIASACSGIYNTRNGGQRWQKVQGIPSTSRRTRAILQHPSIPGLVFAGTTQGFWRSARGGEDATWTVMTSTQLEVNSIAVHPKNPQTVYIGTNNYGVMVSHDAGKHFAMSNNGYSGRFVDYILPDREKPDRVYATTINTTTGGGFFFISNDGGATWQASMRNMSPRVVSSSILQDERDPNVLYLGTNLGLYRSLDRGASWAPANAPKPRPPANRSGRRGRGRGAGASARSERPQDVGAPARGAEASASRTTRSDSTVKRAQEALHAAGYSVGVPDGVAGTRTVAAIRKFQADKGLPVSGTLDDQTLNALGLGSGYQGMDATGKVPPAIAPLTESVNALAHLYEERDGRSGILAATNTGLFRTYDPSQGWERIVYGATLDVRTTCLATSAQNPKTIWAGTTTSGLLVSRDGGQTWEQVAGVPTVAPISSVAQDPKRPSHIYVGTKQTFYYSHDGGENWTRRGGNLPLGDYPNILINPQNTDEIITGNAYEKSGGVYRSTDAGLTWQRIDPSEPRLPSQRIWSLAFDPRDQNKIFVGTHSAGVYVAERGTKVSLSTDK